MLDYYLHVFSMFQVLRLHLKRFRWCGRARHKINTHVHFPQLIDLTKYCAPPRVGVVSISHDVIGGVDLSENVDSKLYDLSSVIIHHGVGFQCGHYTAYCWNSEACKSHDPTTIILYLASIKFSKSALI